MMLKADSIDLYILYQVSCHVKAIYKYETIGDRRTARGWHEAPQRLLSVRDGENSREENRMKMLGTRPRCF